MRNQARDMIIKEKQAQWEKTCQEINSYIGGTRASEAWRTLKNIRATTKNTCKLETINAERWKDYYQQLLGKNRKEFQRNKNEECKSYNYQEEYTEITDEEIKSAVKTFKNKKAPGPGNIPIELLKYAPDTLYELLAELFNRCLKGENIPEIWKIGHIINIHKKGDKNNCTNYRGITILNTLSRVYGKVLKTRIETSYEDQEEQNGFRAGRSCIDGIFSLRQLIDKRLARNLETHLVFIDLEKAYDSVLRH